MQDQQDNNALSFDLEAVLPRHIRRLYKHHEPKPQIPKNGQSILRLDEADSRFGTVGSDRNYNRYPDSHSTRLKEALAAHKEVQPEQIFLGNGSDEVLDVLIRTFCNPGKDRVLFFKPTESRLERLATLNNVWIDEVPLTRFFQLPTHSASESVKENTKIIFINNPNPISGVGIDKYNMLDLIGVVDLLESFEGIVVIDESFIDYIEDESALEYIKNYHNLIIVQSFSRAWGLAGLRLGVAYAHPEIINVLDAVRPPYNINEMAQEVACKALRLPEHKERVVKSTIKERDRLVDVLSQLNYIESVRPSDANFLLVETESVEKLTNYLNDEGIVVYDVSNLSHCDNSVRITVGNPEENEQLIEALALMPKKTSPTRKFLKKVSNSLRKASVFLGAFKKFLGT